MKNLINKNTNVYCDYTIFLNDSFDEFCKKNAEWLVDNNVRLLISQAVVDEMKAVPMARMDDYALCYQGLMRVDKAVVDGIAAIIPLTDGIVYSEDFFYKLCESGEKSITVMTNDFALITELVNICSENSKPDDFLCVLEIEENGMVHRIR